MENDIELLEIPNSKEFEVLRTRNSVEFEIYKCHNCTIVKKENKAIKRYQLLDKNVMREICIIKMCHHENIIDINININDIVEIEMPYYQTNLLTYVTRKNLSDKTKDRFVQQMINGVKYLYDNKIMHLDLKSANVMIDNKGKLKIIDFGTARISNKHYISSDQIVTTLTHRAPEAFYNDKGICILGHCTDLWSLGIIIYEIMNNSNIFLHKIFTNYNKDEDVIRDRLKTSMFNDIREGIPSKYAKLLNNNIIIRTSFFGHVQNKDLDELLNTFIEFQEDKEAASYIADVLMVKRTNHWPEYESVIEILNERNGKII